MNCGYLRKFFEASAPQSIQRLIIVTSIIALAAAYIAEYGFGFIPCDLCLYERWVYFSLIAIGLLSLRSNFLKGYAGIYAQLFILATGIVLTFNHIGVEQHWWAGPPTCSVVNNNTTIEEFRNQLMTAPRPRCDQITWSFLKVSATVWSFFVQLVLGVLAFASLYGPRKKHEPDKA